MSEFKTLLVKMALDVASGGRKGNSAAASNFDYLSDIEVLLSLACFIPLLNTVHCLIKLSQSHDIFICDFLQAIKVCQADLARMFVDEATSFSTSEFKRYQDLISLSCDEILMEWQFMLENTDHAGSTFLVFMFGTTHIYPRCDCKLTAENMYVTEERFLSTQANIQRQFAGADISPQSLCFFLEILLAVVKFPIFLDLS